MNSGWYFPQTTNVIIIMPSFFRYELLFCLWFPYRSLVLLHVFVALIFVLYTLYVYIYIYISAPFTYEFIYFYFITRMCMCYKNLLITRITNVMFCVQGGLAGNEPSALWSLFKIMCISYFVVLIDCTCTFSLKLLFIFLYETI